MEIALEIDYLNSLMQYLALAPLGGEVVFLRALLPLIAFWAMYMVCIRCYKSISKRVGFDLAIISGFLFLCVGAVIRFGISSPNFGLHDFYKAGEYMLAIFLVACISICAFGFGLLCYRLRPSWEFKKVRTILMYILLFSSLVLFVVQIFNFFTFERLIITIMPLIV